MSMREFVRTVTSCGLRFRWFTCNMTELRLPNGKYIVIDPFLPNAADPKWGKMGMSCGYSVKDLAGCDYVIINHAHGDHILQLGEVYERFHPRVLCHANTAMAVGQTFGIPGRDIFPFESHDTYDFGDFILETSEGRHNATKFMQEVKVLQNHASLDYLGEMGSLFNTNLVITTNDSLKIGFSAGEWDRLAQQRWQGVHPNVLFRHRTNWQMEPREMAEVIAEIGAQISIPWHHNNAYDPSFDYDFNDFTSKVNGELEKLGSGCRFLNPERGLWYEVAMTCRMCPEAK